MSSQCIIPIPLPVRDWHFGLVDWVTIIETVPLLMISSLLLSIHFSRGQPDQAVEDGVQTVGISTSNSSSLTLSSTGLGVG